MADEKPIVGEGYVEESLAKANEKGKHWYAVRIGGVRGTTFDIALGKSLKVGAYGEYEFEPKGDFKTLRRFEEKSAKAGTVPTSGDDRDARISRSHAITTAIAGMAATPVKGELRDDFFAGAFQRAEEVMKWTVGGVNPYAGSEDPLFGHQSLEKGK